MKRTHSMTSRAVGAASIFGLMAAAAFADTPPPPPPPPPPPAVSVAMACKPDIQALCPDMKPGEGRIAACLKENRKALSAGCKEAIREHHREKMETAPGATPPPPSSNTPPPPPSH